MTSGGEGGQDFDLNLAPIIDCFTVLITYLLVSASFISVAVLDVHVAALGEAPPNPKRELATPPPSLIVFLRASGNVEFRITDSKKEAPAPFTLSALNGKQNLADLKKKATSYRQQYKNLEEISLSAESEVSYKDVVAAIEQLKATGARVFLGG